MQTLVLTALHTLELHNGDVVSDGMILDNIRNAHNYDIFIELRQVQAVLNRFARKGSYQGTTRMVTFTRDGIGRFVVSW